MNTLPRERRSKPLNLEHVCLLARIHNYTVTSLADACGVRRETMSKILNGRRGATPATVKLLAHALGARESEILASGATRAS
jgi:transcriptional regulator with XRE-family HTH domain